MALKIEMCEKNQIFLFSLHFFIFEFLLIQKSGHLFMPVYTTACPRNCYSTCTMRVYVKNGRLRMIEPHPDNLATPEGVCLKGLSYVERVYSPDRILYPLLTNKSNGEFKQISWEQVFDILSEKLLSSKKNFGPQSILYYSGSGTKGLLNEVGLNFWKLFGGCTTTYGDLCWPAGLEATRLTLGENKHNAPWDIANAKLIIMWGKNPAETNIHQMLYIDKALENGGKLIVIDPRRTQSSERAELLIQPRPGTDGALALALANLLIKNGQIDHSFVENHVHGFEDFSIRVSEIDPEKAAKITDVPVQTIYKLAEYIGAITPCTINAGFGMQRYTNSGQTMRSLLSLLAITGNIGKPGAGWVYANLQTQIFDHVKDPVAFYPPDKPDGKVRVSISTSLLGEQILATNDPPIKMIWVERGNPVTQNPDTNSVLKAFRSMEFNVVIDQFMTDTAREADLVLPAKTLFEQSDIIGAYWHPYIQLKQKVIEPPGEVKPESEIYHSLAKTLGFKDEQLSGLLPGPGDQQINLFLEEKLISFPQLSLEKLKEGPVLTPGLEEVAFSDFKFLTPSGKIEIKSEEAASKWGIDTLPSFKENAESVAGVSPQLVKYPLYFMTPNTKNRIHSQFNNLQYIQQFSEKPSLQMNPHDARDREISDGDSVRIFNDRGYLVTTVSLDFSIKTGCVSMTNGWWINQGGSVNFLSSGRETDIGYGAAFHDNLVEVERTV
jgi:anaerobic selenocysteine-containing dehydrogenase